MGSNRCINLFFERSHGHFLRFCSHDQAAFRVDG